MSIINMGGLIVAVEPEKCMERRVMYATNEEGKRIMMDLCSFCTHYDHEFRYNQCSYQDFNVCVDECKGYSELSPELRKERYQKLFADFKKE